MRFFRPIACAALVSSASACTIWYLATDPYKDAGSDAQTPDSQPDIAASDASSDAPPQLELIESNVGSIAAYGDTLYANIDGALWTCNDVTGCASAPIVPADASVSFPLGIAANDGGVFWVEGNGIWCADLDGAGAALVIKDSNNPSVLALDGPRVSWTTQLDGGAVVNSCKIARKGCNFGDSGIQTGSGGPSQLVAASANINNSKLAAAPGYVISVLDSTGPQTMTITPVDGGAPFLLDFANDSIFKKTSDKTLVANDTKNAYFSVYHKADDTFIVEQVTIPPANVNTRISQGLSGTHNYCLGAGAGIVGYSTATKTLITRTTDGDAGQNIPLGANAAMAMTATNVWVYILDTSGALYRYPRE